MNDNIGNVDERITYINCESGDATGTIHIKLDNGEIKEFSWDSINRYEHQVIAMAMLFTSSLRPMAFDTNSSITG